MHLPHFFQRPAMRQQHTPHLAQGCNGNPVEDIVTVGQQNFADADQGGIELVVSEHVCQARRDGEDDFRFETAG